MQYEELQKAVEEPQPAMHNSRLKSWRNADLRGSKVQKRPEAIPEFGRWRVKQNNRLSPTKSFNALIAADEAIKRETADKGRSMQEIAVLRKVA